MNEIRKSFPHSLEAESGVIGTILNNSQAMDFVQEIINSEDFYKESHKIIFKAMEELKQKGSAIDILTIGELLKNKLNQIGGLSYLTQIMSSYFTTSNIKEYALIVRDKSNRRKIINAANDMLLQAYEEGKTDTCSILNETQDKLLKINSFKSTDICPVFEVATSTMEMLKKYYKNGGGFSGLRTGLRDLDNMVMGMNPADYIVIAARPSMGKTALMLSIGVNVCKKEGKSVLIFSLEMSKESLMKRVFSSISQIPYDRIKSGEITGTEWNLLTDRINQITKNKLFFDDKADQTVIEMKNKAKKVKQEHGLDLIIIDYIGLIRPSIRNNIREQEVSEISKSIKIMAKELKCPVIALSQLSRAPEARTNHRPMLSDLRESGSIEQDADVVMMLYRDEYYNKETEDKNVMENIIAKSRDGKTGTVKLAWLGETQAIGNLDYEYMGPGNSAIFESGGKE